mmetsp:Transcript_26484/g.61212  ORF Transcript_26484/g.61212 Transcript_26484/m.61212 type:complete len:213 (-) Transcript_26484:872-1510(-)
MTACLPPSMASLVSPVMVIARMFIIPGAHSFAMWILMPCWPSSSRIVAPARPMMRPTASVAMCTTLSAFWFAVISCRRCTLPHPGCAPAGAEPIGPAVNSCCEMSSSGGMFTRSETSCLSHASCVSVPLSRMGRGVDWPDHMASGVIWMWPPVRDSSSLMVLPPLPITSPTLSLGTSMTIECTAVAPVAAGAAFSPLSAAAACNKELRTRRQ